jgi:uncharacterized protein
MLVEFRVRNFRSFRDEQAISFVANSDRSHGRTNCIDTDQKSVPRLTRSSVIYGANASGKSNLLFALATLRNMVVQSTSLLEPQFVEQYTPFRLDASMAQEPTGFEVTILLAGVRYQYGFEYDAQRIRGEWLVVYKTGKGQRWFERSSKSIHEDEWKPFSAYFNGPRETWRKATRPQALFLTTAVQLNSEQLKPLFDWITNGMMILTWAGAASMWPTLQRLDEPGFKARVLEVLRAADIHIADIRVDRQPGHQIELKLEPGKTPEMAARDLEVPIVKYLHKVEGGAAIEFDNRYESAGTQKLLAYIGPLLEAIDAGKLLAIDELDSSLHPMVTRFILGLIHDPTISTHNAQLWITTHDTSLLDTEILRRDQVWFVEKDEKQASHLYPLSDFSPRKNEALERGYLRGRYGALPFVSSPDLN